MGGNPCDFGMCNPYQCRDEDCLHTDFVVTDEKQKKVPKNIIKKEEVTNGTSNKKDN